MIPVPPPQPFIEKHMATGMISPWRTSIYPGDLACTSDGTIVLVLDTLHRQTLALVLHPKDGVLRMLLNSLCKVREGI